MNVDYSNVTWTPSQAKGIEQILAWEKSGRRELRLGGLAGTGKTHLIGYIPTLLMRPVMYCAPTGRAASIIHRKTGLETRTVHSLLRYGPQGGEHDEGCTQDASCVCSASGDYVKMINTDDTMFAGTIVIVDESSMIPQKMYHEIMGLGARIIFCGDYGQLPPVGDSKFSVMSEENLDIKLTDIVRQAQDSPIIQAALEVRNGAKWAGLPTSDCVTVMERPSRLIKVAYKPGRFVLCATNRQRIKRNKEMRKRLGLPPDELVVGDVVINLRNDPMRGVYNGQRGIVTTTQAGRDPYTTFMVAEMESGYDYVGDVIKAQFNANGTLANQHAGLFDFGYAMTTHKAQGSEADEVLLIAEGMPWMSKDERRRWNYTAVTRAKEKLTVVIPT